MGMTVEMVDKKGPHFPSPLQSPTDGQFEKVLNGDVDVAAELDYVYKAITLTRRKLEGRVPLIGFCGAPWTLFCYMVEGGGTKLFAQSKTWIYRYPEETKKLLSKIADICVEHLALQVKAGAQLVQVFDSWAGELGPTSYKRYSEPYLADIAQKLPEKLKSMGLDRVPMIVFPKGAWYALDSACDLGYDVVGMDWLQDPADAVKIRGDRKIVLQGNADPGILYGSKEGITEAVEEQVKGFWVGNKGWIANLGHGMCIISDHHLVVEGLTLFDRYYTWRQSRSSQALLRGDSPFDQGIILREKSPCLQVVLNTAALRPTGSPKQVIKDILVSRTYK